MAKISAEQRAANKEMLDKLVLDTFWEHGWDAITLNRISDMSGMRKSTLQSYFPDKKSFGECLRGKVFPVMMTKLDLSSPEEFKLSWETALLSDKKFRMVVHLLVGNSTSDSTSDMTVNGIVRLRQLLTQKWDSETQARDAVYWVLGLSVVRLASKY